MLDGGVAVDAGDAEHLRLSPLVRVEREDERHGVVDARVRVHDELAWRLLRHGFKLECPRKDDRRRMCDVVGLSGGKMHVG